MATKSLFQIPSMNTNTRKDLSQGQPSIGYNQLNFIKVPSTSVFALRAIKDCMPVPKDFQMKMPSVIVLVFVQLECNVFCFLFFWMEVRPDRPVLGMVLVKEEM
jgi:hypothetical protein